MCKNVETTEYGISKFHIYIQSFLGYTVTSETAISMTKFRKMDTLILAKIERRNSERWKFSF